MAQTFSTGPVHVGFAFGGVGAAAVTPTSAAFYYGTTREGPDITEEPSYFDVMNDLAGPKLPLDRGYAGSEHTITLVMTRWDGPLDIAFDRTPNPDPTAVAPAAAGNEGPMDRGRLVSRMTSLQLLMFLSNGGVGGTEPAAVKYRRYYQTMCIGPNKPIWGNKENVRVRIFKAANVFKGIDLSGNNTVVAWSLFDESAAVAALPAPFNGMVII